MSVDGCRVRVVSAGVDDLGLTSALHVAELPHGLFPRLGETFVRSWHRAHVESPHGVTLVALQGGRIVGFALGTTDQRAHVAWIIAHHRRTLLRSAMRSLAVRPAVLARFVRTRALRYARRLSGRRAPALESTEGDPIAVLEALVVAPTARRQAIGSSLVDAFLEVVAVAGTERVELVTKAGSAGAGGFYERNGWQHVDTHIDRDGDPVLTYRTEPRTPSTR